MLPEHQIDVWPGNKRQSQAGYAIDGHQHKAQKQQPLPRPHQLPDLRHCFAEICLLLGRIGKGARAAAVRRALGLRAQPQPATNCAHGYFLTRSAYLDERTHAKDDINQQQAGHGEFGGKRDGIRRETFGDGAGIAAPHFSRCADQAQKADGDIDMHDQLAPALAGADGQKPANGERKTESGRDERSVMNAPGAEETNESKYNQQKSKNNCDSCHSEPPSLCMARISVASCQWSVIRAYCFAGHLPGARGQLLHVRSHLLRRPLVAGIKLCDLALRPDQRSRERVRDRVVGAVCDAHVKILRHLEEFRLCRHGEIPMRKSILRIAADILRAVGAQPLRRVVLRIEADAEQVRFGVECGVRGQLAIDDGEVVRDQRAEVGQRAARVNKSDQQRLAAELIRDEWRGRPGCAA